MTPLTRTDLSNWVVHFVHDRKPENDPSQFIALDLTDRDFCEVPIGFEDSGAPITTPWDSEEACNPTLEADAPAILVLQNIIRQGFLRAGWSFRDQKATIYGPYPAVCFTEMPLYALLNYARSRAIDGLVSPYCVAVLRRELFAAGGRPVIYGLSTPHKEAVGEDPCASKRFRCLSNCCGLGLEEQYRYVATRLSGERIIDWTHEREWRWPLRSADIWVPGLPVWLGHKALVFSQAIVIVDRAEEVGRMLDQLKLLHDSKCNNLDSPVAQDTVRQTRVISLEEIEGISDLQTIRIDDLPFHQLKKIRSVKATEAAKGAVLAACKEARTLAQSAGQKALADALRTPSGDVADVCGDANVVTYETGSEVTAALLELEIASASDKGYILWGLKLPLLDQALCIAEAVADAAANCLTERLGQKFYRRSRWD